MVDELITPKLQMRIFEMYPEVSFRARNGGQTLKHRKLDREGKQERLALLLRNYLAITPIPPLPSFSMTR